MKLYGVLCTLARMTVGPHLLTWAGVNLDKSATFSRLEAHKGGLPAPNLPTVLHGIKHERGVDECEGDQSEQVPAAIHDQLT